MEGAERREGEEGEADRLERVRPRFFWTARVGPLPPNGKPTLRVEEELVSALSGPRAQLLERRVQSG